MDNIIYIYIKRVISLGQSKAFITNIKQTPRITCTTNLLIQSMYALYGYIKFTHSCICYVAIIYLHITPYILPLSFIY